MAGVDDDEAWLGNAQRRAEAIRMLIERHQEEFDSLLEECGYEPRNDPEDAARGILD